MDNIVDEIFWRSHDLHINYSENVAKCFDKDSLRSPLLAAYLIDRGYLNRQHMIESIVLEAKTKGTLFDGIHLNQAVERTASKAHSIKIGNVQIQAYHINSYEEQVLNDLIKFEKTYGIKEDSSDYEIKVFSKISEITIERCNAGDYISPAEVIEGNHFSSDCDTYGTAYGQKASNQYHFYNTETGNYVVLYHRYWCL